MNKNTRLGVDHKMLNAMALTGVIGWVLLVVPDLHFLYKHLIPALGSAKYLAFLIMGIAMFLCLPILLIGKIFNRLIPASCESLIERLMMGLACVLSILLSRSFM